MKREVMVFVQKKAETFENKQQKSTKDAAIAIGQFCKSSLAWDKFAVKLVGEK